MSAGAHRKVCIIGLDGATFSVLDRWVAAGDMPHLGELMARGMRSELVSTIPPVTGPAWTSMTTGVNPGQHGIYDFVKWDADGITPRVVQSGDCTVPRLWDVAGEQGRRVGVFRVPVTYPAWPVNGFMVTGMLSRGPGPEMTHPPSLHEELAERDMAWFKLDGRRSPDPLKYTLQNVEVQRRSHQAMRLLLEKYNPEFFMCVNSEIDHMQHHLWPYCIGTGDAADAKVQRAVRDFYRGVDETIGFLKDFFGDDATYFVVSDHGFGPVHKAFRLNNYLARKGFLSLRYGRVCRARCIFSLAQHMKSIFSRLGLVGLARLALRMPFRLGMVRLGRRSREFAVLAWAVDWSRTLACVKSQSDAGVHVNVRGRYKTGIVEPGEHYEKVLQELISALEEPKDPATGQKVVSHIVRPQQVHEGPYVGEAPDLFLALGNGTIAIENSLGGPLFARYAKMANHRIDGVLVACGPGIKSGTGAPAQIVDVAPTALYAMGLPVPRYMEGKVLTGLFHEDFLKEHPVQYKEVTLAESRKEHRRAVVNEQGEKAVRRRLRDLGYL